MNVLIITPKTPSAITTLAKAVEKHCPHFDIKVWDFHPKRPSLDQLSETPKLLEWADLVDVEYWKSGAKIKELWPDLFAKPKKILTHHNPYDLHKESWEEYDAVVVKNKTQQAALPRAYHIPHGIDLRFYKFNPKLTREKTVNMCVARIEGKKGVREVAQACRELGYKFLLVGRVSNTDYMRQVEEVGGKALEFYENVSEEKKLEIYYQSGVHVCNSVDNFESGTMPILEAMACGVPVLTRVVGLVPDIYNGKNMVIRQGPPEDVEGLKKDLQEMMENYDWRLKLRDYAWETVKNFGERRMARRYSSLYYQVLGFDALYWGMPLVSIITPTYNRGEKLIESLVASVEQDYPNKELVVVDSGSESAEVIVSELRKQTKTPIKYIRFRKPGQYTLAEARNRGVIEAEGDVLVFCDDRLRMAPDAVSIFANVKSKQWWWGEKDDYLKGFVENFSAVRRRDFINGGMFCERMDTYGGLTQETRTRFEKQGFVFRGIRGARAWETVGSKNKSKKRGEIIESKLKLFKMYG